jgi:hypothetical protein
VTNGERLGLTTANTDEWHNKRLFWEGTLYPSYTNPNTRTTTVNTQVKNFMQAFRDFGNPLLEIVAASPVANESDEEALNFKADRKAPTRPTTPLAEQCIASTQSLGGGQARFICRTEHDTARASLAEGADSVQIAYKIGEQPPQDPDDGTKTIISTRASSVQALGADNSGKKLHYYVRWFNTKYPQFAGPWSAVKTVILT